MSSPDADPAGGPNPEAGRYPRPGEPNPALRAGAGCWAIVLIMVGGLIALVSGLCVGAGILGPMVDLMQGAAPLQNVLGVMFLYLLVSVPFLAGGIALIIWGVRVAKRTRRGANDRSHVP